MVLRNTFEGKMLRDALIYRTPSNSYNWAINAVHQDRDARMYGGLVTEESNKKVYDFGGEVKGSAYVESVDSSFYFVGNDEIHMFNHKTQEGQFVASASEFGCSWENAECEDIVPTFKTMQPCNELHMYWSQGCTYYTMNITEMLDPARKAALKGLIAGNEDGCGFGCDYFELMNTTCVPRISPIPNESGGHGLEAGIYRFAAQLEDHAGNTTNWSWVSEKVSIGSENNIGGENSQQSIDIHLSNLDCKYSRVHIAVVKEINGVTTQEVIAEKGYSTDGITFKYYGQFLRPLSSLVELTAKKKRWIRGKEIIQKDGRAWLYKIRQEKNPDMQRRVQSSARVSFIGIETTPRMVEKYSMPTFEGGENYLFGVVYNFTDETNTPVYILTEAGGGGSGAIQPSVTPSRSLSTRADNIDPLSASATSEPSGKAREFNRVRDKGDQFPAEDALDNTVNTSVPAWETDYSDMKEAMDCEDCPEGSETFQEDGPKIENILVKGLDELSSAGQDHDETITSGSLKEAADNFVKKTVEEAERVERKKPEFNINANPGSPASSLDLGPSRSTSSILFADQYTDSNGKSLIEESFKVTQEYTPEIVTTDQVYPESVDCQGQPLYGGLAGSNVRLFQAPDGRKRSFLKAGSNGVPSKENPAIDPIYDNKIELLGLQVTGVPMPSSREEELDWFGKPLCPNQPYRIVMVQRDHINSTVQGKVLVTGTFEGVSRGKRYAIPRNGANGPTLLDRFIDNNGSRVGEDGGNNIYVGYGMDTEVAKNGISAGKFVVEGTFSGIGHRYGLYAKGKEPNNRLTEGRTDVRGYRGAININSFASGGGEYDLSGFSYAPADSVVNAPDGVSLDLLNKNRESCVFFELSGDIGLSVDKSMIADGLDHEAPIKSANMAYGYFKKEIPDQYGSVVGMKFIDTGIVAHPESGGSVRGIVGDSYIGPMTFTRKSYLSDKVGDTYPLKAAGYERDRTVCNSADDAIFEQLALDSYPGKLPESGDKSDARNWANAFWGMQQEPADWSNAADIGFTGIDIYYPKVQTTLIYSFVESRINPWKRASGKAEDEVFVGKLKEWNLDANLEGRHPWEESFLPTFRYEVEQPSKSQLLKKMSYRVLINAIIPLLGTWGLTGIEGVPDAVGYGIASLYTIAQWQFFKKTFLREDYLNKMIGIPTCYTDSEGGEDEDNIRGFKNNYWSYDFSHSRQNDVNIYHSMPLVFNTCDCDECQEKNETTNEIFFSNKQMEGSPHDAYKNFKAFNYLEISADSGKLEDMFVWNGGLYAHTTDGIHMVKFAPVTTQTNIGTSILGGNDLLVDPQIYLEGVTEGFAGTLDPKASINTTIGRFFVDREADKIYRFDGQIEEVSSTGMFNFFKNNVQYCNTGKCDGYRREGNNFYTLGWDPRYNRLLVTKNDKQAPFTVSNDPLAGERKGWISFHSYIPQMYIWDRRDMYTVKSGSLWKHNIPGSYGNFYGTQYEWKVRWVTSTPGAEGELDWFTYNHTILNTEADINGMIIDKTVDNIAVWNTSQGSGIKKVITVSDNQGSGEDMSMHVEENCYILAEMSARKFNINELHDNIKPSCRNKPLTIQGDCEPYDVINESIFNETPPDEQSYTQQILKDDYLVYEVGFKNEKTRMRLLGAATKITK